ncbi:SWIM zinc finger family protein [Lysobacter korlensis]|uniref:SWIM zinc finger family protein n=1 Tax=Lysobacter korlensis TaxID=553636 RepID=A0ABV6S059_9GAMM
MSLLAVLSEQLQRFDEEAFVALANRGLLRRAGKDLEAQPPEITEATGDAVVVAAGGHTVRFDARGPAQASCSCPSAGVCQHILAACLWLQRSAPTSAQAPTPVTSAPDPKQAAEDAPAAAESPSGPEPLETLHAALMAFTPAALSKHASLPGYRWARDFVLDLDPESGVQIGGESHVVIRFSHPRMTFRYLGGQLENLLCDATVSKPEKYRVAAVLAYQRAHGIEPAVVEARGKPQTAALDFGKDHALADAPDATREDSRARLRASTRQLIGECIELGLSHLSQSIHERYSTLAVWAQGAEYYRLALLLRRIADHVELLLDRAGSADEHRLFDELTLAYALTGALEYTAKRGEAPVHLVGRARSRYETAGAMELIGLGAMPWRAASGYIGLTMLFWSVADQAFVSCTDARPELQRGFNPVTRYRSPGPWTGLSSPQDATGRLVTLRDAQISGVGRLSLAERTSATVQPVSYERIREALPICSNWQTLQTRADEARRSLLSEPQPMQDWVVLAPARFGAPKFDAARQTLVWPLHDSDNQLLNAEVMFSDYAHAAIDRIESLGDVGAPTGTVVIARIQRRPTGLVVEPLSLLRPASTSSNTAVDALYFDPAPAESFAGRALGALKRAVKRSAPDMATMSPGAGLPASLRELRTWLVRQAERGIPRENRGLFEQEHRAHAQRLRDSGFDAFSLNLGETNPVDVLLRMQYVQMQFSRLAGVDAGA